MSAVITQYQVRPEAWSRIDVYDRHMFTIDVNLADPERGMWSVCRMGGERLNRDSEWSYSPLPSERTDEWKRQHQFTLAEALDRAEALVEGLTVHGLTAARFAAALGVDDA